MARSTAIGTRNFRSTYFPHTLRVAILKCGKSGVHASNSETSMLCSNACLFYATECCVCYRHQRRKSPAYAMDCLCRGVLVVAATAYSSRVCLQPTRVRHSTQNYVRQKNRVPCKIVRATFRSLARS